MRYYTEDLSNQTKGKIGEILARDYFMRKGYKVWLLDFSEYGPFRGIYTSGTGYNYAPLHRVISWEEFLYLCRSRTFDLLLIYNDEYKEFCNRLNALLGEIDHEELKEYRVHNYVSEKFEPLRELLHSLDRHLLDVKTLWPSTIDKNPDFEYKNFKPTYPEDLNWARCHNFKFHRIVIKIPLKYFEIEEEIDKCLEKDLEKFL